jgi:hypothetical protein
MIFASSTRPGTMPCGGKANAFQNSIVASASARSSTHIASHAEGPVIGADAQIFGELKQDSAG